MGAFNSVIDKGREAAEAVPAVINDVVEIVGDCNDLLKNLADVVAIVDRVLGNLKEVGIEIDDTRAEIASIKDRVEVLKLHAKKIIFL